MMIVIITGSGSGGKRIADALYSPQQLSQQPQHHVRPRLRDSPRSPPPIGVPLHFTLRLNGVPQGLKPAVVPGIPVFGAAHGRAPYHRAAAAGTPVVRQHDPPQDPPVRRQAQAAQGGRQDGVSAQEGFRAAARGQ